MGGLSRVAAAFGGMMVSGAILATSTGNAAVVIDSLLVRVYDSAGVPVADRTRALARANEILARVELDAAWLECPARRSDRMPAPCDVPPAPDEIIVRLVRASAEADRVYSRALGYSLLDTQSGIGTFATIFTDRVNRLSERARFDRASLLGRAIAHEIGHVILGTNDHAGSGLMREKWTLDEVVRNRPDDWHFSAAQHESLLASRLAGAPAHRAAAKPGAGAAGIGGPNPRTLLNKTP